MDWGTICLSLAMVANFVIAMRMVVNAMAAKKEAEAQQEITLRYQKEARAVISKYGEKLLGLEVSIRIAVENLQKDADSMRDAMKGLEPSLMNMKEGGE